MAGTDATELLRSGLLDGVSVLLARGFADGAPAAGSPAQAIREGLQALGARVIDCLPLGDGAAAAVEEQALDAEVERALARAASIEMLVVDGAGLYASGAARAAAADGGAAEGGAAERHARAALGACLDAAWNVTRALAGGAFLAREQPGRIVYLTPPVGAGEHAAAAGAGLENLARTLSIEWARRRVTAVAVVPGEATTAGEVAALTAYLASPAGEYFSGCLLDLRGPA
jgi:NAD(P)-dependent dehydrogenase (short-subunit alcohol dehydrogenase family)